MSSTIDEPLPHSVPSFSRSLLPFVFPHFARFSTLGDNNNHSGNSSLWWQAEGLEELGVE